MASPGARGDGEAVGLPGFLYSRVLSCLGVLCSMNLRSEVFPIAGDCLCERVRQNSGRTNVGEVHVRSVHRDRIDLLVSVKFSTATVTSQIKRRDVSVACGCTRLFPSGRARVTRGLSVRENRWGIAWGRE